MKKDIQAIAKAMQKAEKAQRKATRLLLRAHKIMEACAIKHKDVIGVDVRSVVPKNPDQ